MTELSPGRIIAKLEMDGRAVVADKLKKGVYAGYKLLIIQKWLREQGLENGGKSTVELTGDPKDVHGGAKDLDAEILSLANTDEEAYAAADSATKRKITMAKKKVRAAIEAADEKGEV